MTRHVVFHDFHLFAGIGGGALGFRSSMARVRGLEARFECLGGVDVDPVACRDFTRLVGAPCTQLDLMSRDQWIAYHSRYDRSGRLLQAAVPPDGWREATPDDLRAAAGHMRPDVILTSPPCRGLSGLLSSRSARSARYQALNQLVVRGIWLALEAWGDDPPSAFLLENVPRIANRGRALLEQVENLLRAYGYAVTGFPHDCGELGGLAQHRLRYLLIARHTEKLSRRVLVPPKRPLRSIGEVLSELPVPGTDLGGPMHRLPSLQWRTWLRLSLIPAGKDWRALRELPVIQGPTWRSPDGREVDSGRVLRDQVLVPMRSTWRDRTLGVLDVEAPAGTITSRAEPTTGAFSIADPRIPDRGRYQPYGVVPWNRPARTITAQAAPGAGPYSIQDPRPAGASWHRGVLGVLDVEAQAGTITGNARPVAGAFSIADPRLSGTPFNNCYRVMDLAQPSCCVTGGTGPRRGGLCIADTVPDAWRHGRRHFEAGGHYGVLRWEEAGPTVIANAKWDRGPWSVADHRVGLVPIPANQRCRPLIISRDGTWHRPLTSLELAALQGFPVSKVELGDGQVVDFLVLEGGDSVRRHHIGNAMPAPAVQAIGSTLLHTLLLQALGLGMDLNRGPVWVERRVALALAMPDHLELGGVHFDGDSP